MYYLFYGTDTEKARAKMHEVLNGAKKKRPDAEVFTVESEQFSGAVVDSLVGGAGLFEKKYIVIFDRIFENEEALRMLLRECAKAEDLSCWIGGNLHACSALAIPYKINQSIAGSIAILGPNRIPYRKLFGILETASEAISQSLTRSLYKFKITFRHPEAREYLLLENKK